MGKLKKCSINSRIELSESSINGNNNHNEYIGEKFDVPIRLELVNEPSWTPQ